jgi:hypothetical protein
MNTNHSAITVEKLDAAWEQIRSKLPHADGQSFLKKELTFGPLTLSAVIRVADGMLGLLLHIPQASLAAKWPIKHYAGVRFDSMVKLDDGYGLPLMLVDLKARDIFAQLAADITSTAVGEETADAMLSGILSRLALWRRFLQNRTGKMSDEEIRGLIGELSVLGDLLLTKGVDFCLDAWMGPLGELHDFRLPNHRIEVKSWCNDSLPRIFISNPNQIVADEACPVWIAAVQISKDEKAGRTLSEWVGPLTKSMDASQKEFYHSLLADYGFLAAQSELYTDRYAVIETVFYAVTRSFPRIDPEAIPLGISSVKFAIELNAIVSHRKPSPITGETTIL